MALFLLVPLSTRVGNWKSYVKIIQVAIVDSRAPTILLLSRTLSFEEYEGTPGFLQFGTSHVTKDGTAQQLSNASIALEHNIQENQDLITKGND